MSEVLKAKLLFLLNGIRMSVCMPFFYVIGTKNKYLNSFYKNK
ncbi:hypothetical protein HMPREF9554_02599 [Treponema phagedenis F0421]|nr:hypothetical protein HMPREF9554_02599 [Treponema phagedenis F0421]